jgi:putative flavoprotein involved in K+ transport
MRSRHVVIIGAGPAGLAAAVCLAGRGVAYTLVERGGAPAAALRTVDPAMALFSPTSLSRLPGMTLAPAAAYPTIGELVAALDRYRDEHRIAIRSGHAVTAVEPRGDGFVVRCDTAAGAVEIAGTHVISATGLAGHPILPGDFDRSASRLRWKHSVDVRRADVAAARRLLVVGAGASAADVLGHWLAVRAATDRAWIAARSKIRALPRRVLGIDSHWWVWPFEHLPGRPFGPRLSPSDAMWGNEVLREIKRGTIEQVAVARYHAASVELADGRALEPDLLVFASGFAHDTRHLGDLIDRDPDGWPIARGCESRRTPGLYVLGSRYARTLASPYLRGIARDAEYVAARIAR